MSRKSPASHGEDARTEAVKVSIGGREYRLRGSDAPLLKSLATHVDRTIEELTDAGGRPDDFKVAVLAALNIAGEQQEQRADWSDRARELHRRSEDLIDRLQAVRARFAEPEST